MMRIVFAAANPRTSSPLRLGQELRDIEARLVASAARDEFELSSVFAARPADLLTQMNRVRPQILHFSGHGSTGGELILEGDDTESKPVTPQALRALFRSFRPELQVVVLNACFSGTQAEAFLDVVDAVVGMNSSIGDQAAVAFASAFYQALGFRRSVAEAFEQGKAAILLEGISEADTPVLLCRNMSNVQTLTLTTSPALQRSQDPRVPEHLRTLLRSGVRLLTVSVEGSTGSSPLHFQLVLRHSDTTYVVEANPQMTVRDTAAALANDVLGPVTAREYDWTLIRRELSGEVDLADFHTLELSGITPGSVVLLVGNHRRPTWAPNMLYSDRGGIF